MKSDDSPDFTVDAKMKSDDSPDFTGDAKMKSDGSPNFTNDAKMKSHGLPDVSFDAKKKPGRATLKGDGSAESGCLAGKRKRYPHAVAGNRPARFGGAPQNLKLRHGVWRRPTENESASPSLTAALRLL
jgi:hypothetical protein